MARKDELKITLVLEGKDAQKALRSFNQELGDTEDAAKKSSSGLDNVMGSIKGLILPAAGAAGAIATIKKAIDWAEQGAKIEQAHQALVAYAGGADEAEAAINAIKGASEGLLSEFEATEAANKFLAMGLAETANEAARLTDIAVTLGKSMGMEAGPAIENFALMLSNNSIPRMDSYGMSADKAHVRIEELMVTNEGLTRNQAFVNAVLEQGSAKLKQLEDAGYNATTEFEKFQTELEDMQNNMKKFLAGPGGDFFKFMNRMVGGVEDDINAFNALSEQYIQGEIDLEEYNSAVDELIAKLAEESDGINMTVLAYVAKRDEIIQHNEAMRILNETEEIAIDLTNEYGEALQEGWQYLHKHTDETHRAWEEGLRLAKIHEATRKEVQNLFDTMNTGLDTTIQSWIDSIEFLQRGGLAVQLAFQELQQQLIEGKVTQDEAIARGETLLEQLDKIMAGGTAEYDIVYNIRYNQVGTTYSGGGSGGGEEPTPYQHGGPLSRIAKVGEGGWEYIINGIVVPHGLSKQLERIGLMGRGYQSGGTFWSPPLPDDDPTIVYDAERGFPSIGDGRGSGGSKGSGSSGGGGSKGAPPAVEEIAEDVLSDVEEAVVGKVQPVLAKQTASFTSQVAHQSMQVEETNKRLDRVIEILGDLASEDAMRQIMEESQNTSGF
jgi:hypothetical protein